ncbi:AAA family ATPase [Brevundimonas phoenicis]|uniref:AAA family ATPase n=1 Tax=unclassified Brevundimonas TaxID=2622653 RepID=UPI0039A305DA
MLGMLAQDDAIKLFRTPPEDQPKARSVVSKVLGRVPDILNSPSYRFDQRIARVEIENFKSIDQLSFEVQSTGPDGENASALMLLADNAAGKTSALQAIALALMGPERASQLPLDRSGLIRNGAAGRWGQVQKAPAGSCYCGRYHALASRRLGRLGNGARRCAH